MVNTINIMEQGRSIPIGGGIFRLVGVTEADIDAKELIAKAPVRRIVSDNGKRSTILQPVDRLIWSVGKRIKDGAIFASTDARYYGDPEFKCIWLR